MNRLYRHIWSKILGRLVVVPECARGGGGGKSGRRRNRQRPGALTSGTMSSGPGSACHTVPDFSLTRAVNTLLAVLVSSSMLTQPLHAQDLLPTGGQVVSGAATIASSGGAMVINQSSDRMIANWQGFSIGAGNSVTFNQPGSSSVALNRVTGQSASQILGSLNANGQVFLINPNGIAIGAGGSVQTGAFVAATLGLGDADFLSGDYKFSGTGGAISNAGAIEGTTVALIAPNVSNTGTIRGNTALAAGTGVLLDFDGDGLLSVEVTESTMATLVENKGVIAADGGVAILTAKGASAARKGVVNTTGTIEASSIGTRDGRILLLADMDTGEVKAGGRLRARSVETSAAKVTLDRDLKVDTDGGHWLIDPIDILIDAASAAAIETGLASGNVTVSTYNGGAGAEPGNITVDAAMSWDAHVLTLRADNDIAINASLTSSGTTASDGLVLQYGQTTGTGSYTINAPVNLASGSLFQTKSGTDAAVTWTVLTGLGAEGSTSGADLQGISGNLSGHFVLGADIDASATAGWNGGAGFDPLGNAGAIILGDPSTNFTGSLDGLGHTISGLTINRPGEGFVGLFGVANGAPIRNLGLVGSSIVGNYDVGGLAGHLSDTEISNVYSIGTVSGISRVGGLVGFGRSTFSNVHSAGSVTAANWDAGGLIGAADSGTRVINSHSTAAVTAGVSTAGGLIGETQATEIVNSYATGAVSGAVSTGGLVGHAHNATSIDGSYASGTVAGSENVGGLVGWLENSRITQSYATGSVSGDTIVGGLVGRAEDHGTNVTGIANAYATGLVSGTESGGLIGQVYVSDPTSSVEIADSFWDMDTTGQSAGCGSGDCTGATGLSTAGALTQAAYAGFDFTNDWFMIEGSTRPFLRSEYSTTITNTHQLQLMAMDLSASYLLGNDIDFGNDFSDGSRSDMWATSAGAGSGFDPVGDLAARFTGGFDGRDHTISNLGINRAGDGFVGLFGYASGASIGHVGLVGGSILGSSKVGALLGRADDSDIIDAYATTSVTSIANKAGGLIGYAVGGSITGSHAGGAVGGVDNVGGLVGQADEVTITDAHASGTVSGRATVGGLVGYGANLTVDDAYAEGAVDGTGDYVGGLIGVVATGGTLTRTHATGDVTGNAQVGGLVGGTSGVTISDGYATGTVSSVSGASIGGLIGYAEGGSITGSHASGDVSGEDQVGGLVGGAALVTISDVHAEGSVGGNQGIGGLVGRAFDSAISAAYATGAVVATGVSGSSSQIGGLVGLVFGGTLTSSHAGGDVTGDTQVGGLAGYADSVAISDVYAEGAVTGTGSSVGGLVGYANGGSISDAHATGAVGGSTQVGGLVGFAQANEISDAYASGAVSSSGHNDAGGLVGYAEEATITDAYATGTVGGHQAVGGLVGYAYDSIISRAFASGTVTGSGIYVGGLAGVANAGAISDAYASGAVSGSDYVGGLTGFARDGTISKTYASGLVSSGGTNVGGLSGYLLDGSIDLSFWDLETTGQAQACGFGVCGATGLTTAAMNNPFSFMDAGWDFSSVWGKLKSGGAPVLRTLAADPVYDYYVRLSGNVISTYGDVAPTDGVTLDGIGVDNVGLAFSTGTNAGSHAFSESGVVTLSYATGTAADYYVDYGSGAVTVNKRVLDLSGGRAYDGTTTVGAGALTLGNLANGEALILSGAGSVADRNVGTGKEIALGTLGLADGTGLASNYTLTGGTATLDIARALLTLAGFTADNKTYDGTTAATIAETGTLSGLISGDDVSFSGTGASFADKNAGSGKTVTLVGIGLSGADSANYSISATATTTADIAKALLTLAGFTADNKTYDGTKSATIADAGALTGLISGDDVSFAGTGASFDDRNAGSGKTVTLGGISLSGADASNYSVAATAVTTADIARAVISAVTGIVASNRTYDGTTAATLDTSTAGFTGIISGDELTVASASGAFDDKNAASGKTVRITGLGLGGGDAGNYTLASSVATTTADIARAVISAITGIAALDKTYDGTTDATLDAASAGFTGMISGDDLAVTGATGAFNDKNAGTGKSVAISGLSLGGADAGNYTLASTTATATADIARALLTLAGFTVENKTYDGTTDATIADAGTLSGLVSGDDVTFAGTEASFADRNAGTGKTVTLAGVSLSGADAANYAIAATATTTADIARAVISAITGIVASNRTYDGTTAATLDTSTAGFTGIISGDELTVAGGTGAFEDKNAGAGKTVGITGLGLGGGDAGNYTLASSLATTTADIARAVISAISGIIASDRTYDGTTDATLDTASAGFAGIISGDELTVAGGTGAFEDKNAGTGKSVDITGLTLGGADAGNYTLGSTVASTTADIAKAVISAISGIAASGKTYDGTTEATLDTASAGFSGMISGDDLAVAGATGAFNDKNAGTGKSVAISGLGLGGADAGNYTLASTTAATTADIARAVISAITGIVAFDKAYDGTTAATLDTASASFTQVIPGDVLTVATGSGTFSDGSAGSGKTVRITGLSLGGVDAGNYTLADTTASALATISGQTQVPEPQALPLLRPELESASAETSDFDRCISSEFLLTPAPLISFVTSQLSAETAGPNSPCKGDPVQ
ncbi:filamentous hemagglutinin family protein [Hoeflea marina]|uniref:Filamentous hemagglutinin family protein n=1 Tax=Hoeflea marina TaxID=274592 RepID=A0A317PGC6_9HYPH|nr:YDG domain-containing protein [Hoeflea marina]PWV95613.1 filamentous hemagglutinin family protein [Hoeflea marina]